MGMLATKFGNQRGEDGSFLGVNGRPSPEQSTGAISRRIWILDNDLTPSDLERIEEVAPKGVAAGERYHEAEMRTING